MRMLIYGAGRVGRQIQHLLTDHFGQRCTVAGFVDDERRPGDVVTGDLRVLGDLATVARFPATSPRRVCLVPALDPDDQPARGRALEQARLLGYQFPIIVHPDACVEPEAALGPGVVVQAGALVSRSVRVSAFCHLDSGAILGAGSRLETNVHLAAGVTLGDHVHIGRDTIVGLHSTVSAGVTVESGAVIAPHVLVGAERTTSSRLIPVPSLSRTAAPGAVVFDEVSHV